MSFVTESSEFQFFPLGFFASSEQNPNPKFPRAKPAKSAKNYGMDENTIAACVINRALDIHKEVGPGLLESVYEVLLADALEQGGFTVERQKPISIQFRGKRFDEGFSG
jgi:PD-(D/E)XK nuclease superfamily